MDVTQNPCRDTHFPFTEKTETEYSTQSQYFLRKFAEMGVTVDFRQTLLSKLIRNCLFLAPSFELGGTRKVKHFLLAAPSRLCRNRRGRRRLFFPVQARIAEELPSQSALYDFQKNILEQDYSILFRSIVLLRYLVVFDILFQSLL